MPGRRIALLAVALLALAVPGAAVPASSRGRRAREGARAVVRRDRRCERARAGSPGGEHEAPDRLADEGDDRADRDRARQPRGPRRRHPRGDAGRAVQGGPRRRTRLHARDAALVGAPRVEQRLRHGPRDRRRRRLAGGLLRARQPEGEGARDDLDDVRERVGPRRRAEPLDRARPGAARPRRPSEPDCSRRSSRPERTGRSGPPRRAPSCGSTTTRCSGRRPAPTA